ncbi:hypothetical protein ACIBG7_43305 [Nonomuraea sp. NPDC050328]|uniref:hypothetical protein n=1 Tax=Nonomuraea sp. NPDC050328 TaxID=3364361 RepID=UPI0037A4177D
MNAPTRRDRLRRNPFGTSAGAGAVVLGVLGLIVGEAVSQGMTNSLRGAAGPVAHLWGLELAAGGLLKIFGLYWHHSELEIPGLWLMCGGYAFYSITVVVGLGAHGLAAGIIAGALTIGCLVKVRQLQRLARATQESQERGEA